MIAQHVCLPCDWCVDIYYDARPKDADHILNKLWDMGCAQQHLYKAEDLLKSGVPNQGLTYSNPRKRRSLIVIGRVTDFWQALDSISHEKQHLEQAICREDGLDPYGEEIAYISGDISAAIARNAWLTMRKLFLYLL